MILLPLFSVFIGVSSPRPFPKSVGIVSYRRHQLFFFLREEELLRPLFSRSSFQERGAFSFLRQGWTGPWKVSILLRLLIPMRPSHPPYPSPSPLKVCQMFRFLPGLPFSIVLALGFHSHGFPPLPFQLFSPLRKQSETLQKLINPPSLAVAFSRYIPPERYSLPPSKQDMTFCISIGMPLPKNIFHPNTWFRSGLCNIQGVTFNENA